MAVIHTLRLYSRALLTSEIVGNFQAGASPEQGAKIR